VATNALLTRHGRGDRPALCHRGPSATRSRLRNGPARVALRQPAPGRPEALVPPPNFAPLAFPRRTDYKGDGGHARSNEAAVREGVRPFCVKARVEGRRDPRSFTRRRVSGRTSAGLSSCAARSCRGVYATASSDLPLAGALLRSHVDDRPERLRSARSSPRYLGGRSYARPRRAQVLGRPALVHAVERRAGRDARRGVGGAPRSSFALRALPRARPAGLWQSWPPTASTTAFTIGHGPARSFDAALVKGRPGRS